MSDARFWSDDYEDFLLGGGLGPRLRSHFSQRSGAGHESGRRAGTESALLAVALGKAAELARDLTMDRVRTLCDRLWHGLRQQFGDGVVLNVIP